MTNMTGKPDTSRIGQYRYRGEQDAHQSRQATMDPVLCLHLRSPGRAVMNSRHLVTFAIATDKVAKTSIWNAWHAIYRTPLSAR